MSRQPTDAYLVSVDDKKRTQLKHQLQQKYPGIRTYDMEAMSNSPPSSLNSPQNSSYDSGQALSRPDSRSGEPPPWYRCDNDNAETSFIQQQHPQYHYYRNRSATPAGAHLGTPSVRKTESLRDKVTENGTTEVLNIGNRHQTRITNLPVTHINTTSVSNSSKVVQIHDPAATETFECNNKAINLPSEKDLGYESDLWKRHEGLPEIGRPEVHATQRSPSLSALRRKNENLGMINPAFSPTSDPSCSPASTQLSPLSGDLATVIALDGRGTPSTPDPKDAVNLYRSNSDRSSSLSSTTTYNAARLIWRRYSFARSLGCPQTALITVLADDVDKLFLFDNSLPFNTYRGRQKFSFINIEISHSEEMPSSKAQQELQLLISQPHIKALFDTHDKIAQSLQESCPHATGIVVGLKETVLDNSRNAGQVRIIHLAKDGETPLGATVRKDGDAVHVGRVVKGGVAEKSGLLRENDQILEVNGVDIAGKSIEAVCDILASITGEVMLKVIPAPLNESSASKKLTVVKHMKALFDYEPDDDPYVPCRELALGFKKGEILHVISTADSNWWQAFKDGEDHPLACLIPSDEFQRRRELFNRETMANSNIKRNESFLCSSVMAKGSVRKRPRHAQSMDRVTTDAKLEEMQKPVLTYEEVLLYISQSGKKRPVVLVGPIGCLELRQQLLEQEPDRLTGVVPHTSRPPVPNEMNGVHYWFVTRPHFQNDVNNNKFLEWGEFQKHYYGTSVDAIRNAINKGLTCILTLKPQSLPVLRNSSVMPYVIYIAPPSYIEKLKLLVHQIRSNTGKALEVKTIIQEAKTAESQYGHCFDKTIVYSDHNQTFQAVLHTINKLETQPHWVPSEWLAEAGTLNQNMTPRISNRHY